MAQQEESMSREFKFRAWNYYRDNTDITIKHYKMQYFSLGTLLEGYGDEGPVTPQGEEPNVFSSAIIMQYTGLKDKNGKEIYESDIVQYTNDGVAIMISAVEWCEGGYFPLTTDECGCGSHCEIIGNIYENSKLLKQEKGDEVCPERWKRC